MKIRTLILSALSFALSTQAFAGMFEVTGSRYCRMSGGYYEGHTLFWYTACPLQGTYQASSCNEAWASLAQIDCCVGGVADGFHKGECVAR